MDEMEVDRDSRWLRVGLDWDDLPGSVWDYKHVLGSFDSSGQGRTKTAGSYVCTFSGGRDRILTSRFENDVYLLAAAATDPIMRSQSGPNFYSEKNATLYTAPNSALHTWDVGCCPELSIRRRPFN